MSHPDNALEDLQLHILRLVQRYEQGQSRLGDLAGELAELAGLYRRSSGDLEDPYTALLAAAGVHVASQGAAPLDDWEAALREFRHAIW
jgi:hypothetical protein